MLGGLDIHLVRHIWSLVSVLQQNIISMLDQLHQAGDLLGIFATFGTEESIFRPSGRMKLDITIQEMRMNEQLRIGTQVVQWEKMDTVLTGHGSSIAVSPGS